MKRVLRKDIENCWLCPFWCASRITLEVWWSRSSCTSAWLLLSALVHIEREHQVVGWCAKVIVLLSIEHLQNYDDISLLIQGPAIFPGHGFVPLFEERRCFAPSSNGEEVFLCGHAEWTGHGIYLEDDVKGGQRWVRLSFTDDADGLEELRAVPC